MVCYLKGYLNTGQFWPGVQVIALLGIRHLNSRRFESQAIKNLVLHFWSYDLFRSSCFLYIRSYGHLFGYPYFYLFGPLDSAYGPNLVYIAQLHSVHIIVESQIMKPFK